MAIVEIKNFGAVYLPKQIHGLSSDTKPVIDYKMVNGTLYLEIDTGKKYEVINGEWVSFNDGEGSPPPAIPTAYEEITLSGTEVKKLTPSVYTLNSRATITFEFGNCRVRADGGTPSSTSGTEIYIGDVVELETHTEIVNFTVTVAEGSTTATLRVSYSN